MSPPNPKSYLDVMKPEDISIAHLWTHFAAIVVPMDATIGQREDMRRCFYSGFMECFKIVSDLSVGLPEDKAAAMLDRINGEVLEFFNEMKRRYG